MTPLDSALVLYKTILTKHKNELKEFIADTFGLIHIELQNLELDLNQMEKMNSSEDEVVLRYIDDDEVYRVLYNQKKNVYFSEVE